jgi:hypothetical protein
MRTEPDANKDSSVAVVDEIIPRSPWRVTAVETLPDYRLRVVFADGLSGEVDMSKVVRSPKAGVFARLTDASLFAQVRLEYGAVTWPGELDLAPDAMHEAIRQSGKWEL